MYFLSSSFDDPETKAMNVSSLRLVSLSDAAPRHLRRPQLRLVGRVEQDDVPEQRSSGENDAKSPKRQRSHEDPELPDPPLPQRLAALSLSDAVVPALLGSLVVRLIVATIEFWPRAMVLEMALLRTWISFLNRKTKPPPWEKLLGNCWPSLSIWPEKRPMRWSSGPDMNRARSGPT